MTSMNTNGPIHFCAHCHSNSVYRIGVLLWSCRVCGGTFEVPATLLPAPMPASVVGRGHRFIPTIGTLWGCLALLARLVVIGCIAFFYFAVAIILIVLR